ncbi:DUF2788 domain-containing protein [Alteromonas pelagimontana]|uniref:DUF2788 domain-containing protein n=1 Tax=Alteromonas pelagimontana TaxID=1858656 RepID=A0A6M4M869_9ALTE|nr:DUF2788 domain-containing protein [Alteromonas pelagimontana]QJR79421.1 DUF2788 domain-containing protein [Alteromonas pelagimontana]
MLAENYELIESIVLYLGLFCLFVLMGFAVHDVLKKNNVPLIGRVVAYGVLGLGSLGFIAKGIIEIFWLSSGI